MTTTCSKCGSSLAADVRFCPQCGTPISYYSNSGVLPYDPTAASFRHSAPQHEPATDYGSSPYGVPPQNPYEPLNPYEAPLRPPPPPPKRRRVWLWLVLVVLVGVVGLYGGVKALVFQTSGTLQGIVTAHPSVTANPSSTPTHTTHIVGYWKFGEGAGNIVSDSSEYHRVGTISGAVWSPNHAPVTGSTYSLSFDGSGGLVSVPDSAGLDFSATDPLTISLWFNLSASPSIWHAIGKRAGCNDLTAINYQLAFDSAHGLLFDSGGNIVATGITSVPTGVWTHFAATYSPESQSLVVYLNGKSVVSRSGYVLSAENTAELFIAESGTCGYTFPGNLDEVCILRQTLSESQIAGLAHGLPCNDVS